MHRLALSADEVVLLKNHFKYSPIALIRVKAQAILMSAGGLGQEEIAELVVRDIRSVQRYIDDFSRKRLASLFSGHLDNENASKLTRDQKEEIRRVLQKTPEEGGLPSQFWDVPKLKEYIKAEFGVVYESSVSYHYLLKFSGLSFKYPDKLSPRRDEAYVKKRIREIKKEIEPLLKDDRWLVFASDETRIQLEAEIRRAWLIKGKRTVVKTEKDKEHQNYIGFLNQKDGRCQIFETKRGNQRETIRILKKLTAASREKRVCVIWDNARWHKGKLLRRELRKGNRLERLHLINFPPYAPEVNPIEHVWQFAKSKTSNINKGEFQMIKNNFSDIINSRTFNYKI